MCQVSYKIVCYNQTIHQVLLNEYCVTEWVTGFSKKKSFKKTFVYNLKDRACLSLDKGVLILKANLLKKAIEAIFMNRGASETANHHQIGLQGVFKLPVL